MERIVSTGLKHHIEENNLLPNLYQPIIQVSLMTKMITAISHALLLRKKPFLICYHEHVNIPVITRRLITSQATSLMLSGAVSAYNMVVARQEVEFVIS